MASFIRKPTRFIIDDGCGHKTEGTVKSYTLNRDPYSMYETVDFTGVVDMPKSTTFAPSTFKLSEDMNGLSFTARINREISDSLSIAYDKAFTAALIVGNGTGNPQGILTNKEQPEMNLYEYAVIYVPEDEDGDEIKDGSKILVEPTHVLGAHEEGVRRRALREYDDANGTIDPDFVRVLIRPFGCR
jgi:hypothetical protein